jgi:tetratricopeptide (TPR) repeat protein
MATTKLTKKQVEQDEFIDTVFDLGEWLEVHWRRVAIAAVSVVAAVLLGFGWISMRERTAASANELLAKGMSAFQPDAGAAGKAAPPNYGEALTLFEQAADKAGSQPVGEIASLYRGRTLIAMGRAAEATPILTPIASSGNARLAAQAKVALAEAASASGDYDGAATLLQDVITSMASAYPPDGAMMRLAGVRASQGKPADARRLYDDLVAKYPQSPFASEARQRSTDLAAGK